MAGIRIGLKNLYYAILTEDPLTGRATYETPKRIAGVNSATINPNPQQATYYGDDKGMETAATLGEIGLELKAASVPFEDQAKLLGHELVNGVLVRKSSSSAPWVAVGFETPKSNGKSRFVWLVKGKFTEGSQEAETKQDNISFQDDSLTGSFVARDSDEVWQYHFDEDALGLEETSPKATWFTKVYDHTTAVVPTALKVSVKEEEATE